MKKIVVIGGGTGLSSMLKGMKRLEDVDLTAIVTVADDGGSTGFLISLSIIFFIQYSCSWRYSTCFMCYGR